VSASRTTCSLCPHPYTHAVSIQFTPHSTARLTAVGRAAMARSCQAIWTRSGSTSRPLFGDSGQVNDPSVDFFVGLESQVWDALARGDATADHVLLSDDFIGVYPTGFADRSDHVGQLDQGSTVADYDIEVETATVRMLTQEHALLSYEARFRRHAGDGGERVYVSSLWSRRGGRWVNVFSQDTPASG
jgi:hypothetical protein